MFEEKEKINDNSVTNAPGRNYLRVCGILAIIFGIVVQCVKTPSLVEIGFANFIFWVSLVSGLPVIVVVIHTILMLAVDFYLIFVGCLGIAHCKKISKAKIIRVNLSILVVLVAVLCVYDFIWTMAEEPHIVYFSKFAIQSVVGGVFYPLFFTGANKNIAVAVQCDKTCTP